LRRKLEKRKGNGNSKCCGGEGKRARLLRSVAGRTTSPLRKGEREVNGIMKKRKKGLDYFPTRNKREKGFHPLLEKEGEKYDQRKDERGGKKKWGISLYLTRPHFLREKEPEGESRVREDALHSLSFCVLLGERRRLFSHLKEKRKGEERPGKR